MMPSGQEPPFDPRSPPLAQYPPFPFSRYQPPQQPQFHQQTVNFSFYPHQPQPQNSELKKQAREVLEIVDPNTKTKIEIEIPPEAEVKRVRKKDRIFKDKSTQTPEESLAEDFVNIDDSSTYEQLGDVVEKAVEQPLFCFSVSTPISQFYSNFHQIPQQQQPQYGNQFGPPHQQHQQPPPVHKRPPPQKYPAYPMYGQQPQQPMYPSRYHQDPANFSNQPPPQLSQELKQRKRIVLEIVDPNTKAKIVLPPRSTPAPIAPGSVSAAPAPSAQHLGVADPTTKANI